MKGKAGRDPEVRVWILGDVVAEPPLLGLEGVSEECPTPCKVEKVLPGHLEWW